MRLDSDLLAREFTRRNPAAFRDFQIPDPNPGTKAASLGSLLHGLFASPRRAAPKAPSQPASPRLLRR